MRGLERGNVAARLKDFPLCTLILRVKKAEGDQSGSEAKALISAQGGTEWVIWGFLDPLAPIPELSGTQSRLDGGRVYPSAITWAPGGPRDDDAFPRHDAWAQLRQPVA